MGRKISLLVIRCGHRLAFFHKERARENQEG